MSAATETKAKKYLADGKVKVRLHGRENALIEVQGSEATPYEVKFSGVWSCNCPARMMCAHIIAARLISPLVEKERPSLGTVDAEILKLIT